MNQLKNPVKNAARTLSVLAAALLLASPALAHETKLVAGGKYKVIVGSRSEPATTMQVNGLDLMIRTADDKPVPDLEKSLQAEIVSPDGKFTKTLKLRAQFGKPGAYTDDYVFSVPGAYTIRISGYIGDQQFSETFKTHDVVNLADLMFPPIGK